MIKTFTLNESGMARTFFAAHLRRSNLLVMALLSLSLFVFSASSAHAAPYTYSSLADSGPNTLRAAIEAANSQAGPHTITYTGTAGTINLVTPLPAITQTVEIGNFSSNGVIVHLNGAATRNSTTPPSYGLDIQAPNSVVNNLVITRFGDAGIRIGPAGSGTTLYNNSIGVLNGGTACPTAADPSVMEVCGNTSRGVFVQGASGVQIGLGASRPANVISGNFGRGISIASTTVGGTVFNASATVRGNYIGTNSNGTVDLGNTQQGILIASASGSIIGGTSGSDRNIISGNNGNGISIIGDASAPATNNTVLGNFIGVSGTRDSTSGGNAALPNNGSGITINAASGYTIGGMFAAARNIISANTVAGIAIGSNLSTGNNIFGNYIGVDATGATVLGTSGGPNTLANGDNGIRISDQATNNNIGNPPARGTCNAPCNIIAGNGNANTFSARAGIYVDGTAGTRNKIRGNSIFSNIGLGIDLGVNPIDSTTPGTGTTANDTNDPDTGANNLQNFPNITSVDSNGNIAGNFNSLPNTIFAIDYYSNSAADAGTGEGRTYIGTTNVVTDSSGNANASFATTTPVAAGQTVTATATNLSSSSIGDTSEFSAAQTVVAATGANAAGIEADVFPRSNGDGNITTGDVGQIKRFSLGQDRPYQSNEFQRADCFPVDTRGDGNISASDVGQAKRYQLGLDSPQTAGGPTTGTPARPDLGISIGKARGKSERNAPQAPRTVYVVNTTTNANSTVTVTIGVDAAGDESIYGFSVNYNSDGSNRLTNPVVNNPSPATRQVSTSIGPGNTNPGEFGVNVDFSGAGNGQIGAGNNQTLITITFTVPAGAMNGTVPINFTDTPTTREVTSDPNDGPIQILPTTFTNNPTAVTIGAVPPAVTRTVRVVNTTTNPGGTVTVTIAVDAAGDESIYGFSVNYNSDGSNRLTNPVVNNPSPATRQVSTSIGPGNTNPGEFGVNVDFSGAGNGQIGAGNGQTLITITFTVPMSAMTGNVPITFTDNPTTREVTSDPNDGPIQLLPTTFTGGNVRIAAAPTAADVTVKGRVTARGRGVAGARVSMTGGDGKIRYATTNTFGYYQFAGVPAGETYVFKVRAKRSEFAARVVSVNEDVDGLNFAGQ